MYNMKLLVIICSSDLEKKWCDNIKILNDYIKLLNMDVDYCGISSQDDFNNYEGIISFKYKIINAKRQFSKICDFISDYKPVLEYDWYIKIRPDVLLLENINFNILSENAINARARVYYGPSKIKYGMSVNGEGIWKNIGNCYYDDIEHDVVLDDQIFIFHKNMIILNAFDKIEHKITSNNYWDQFEYEFFMSSIFKSREISFNVIGINLILLKYNTFSGNLNMN